LYGFITHLVDEGGTLSVVVLAGVRQLVELHPSRVNRYWVPGAALGWTLTLRPFAVVTHPVPFHFDVDIEPDGHFTTEAEENPGSVDVTT
jgi:hypothetical protein